MKPARFIEIAIRIDVLRFKNGRSGVGEYQDTGTMTNALPRKYRSHPKPTCFKCGRLADYCLHGSWVCLKCYPWDWASRLREGNPANQSEVVPPPS